MKVDSFLNQQGVQFERSTHAKAYTAQELAHAERVSGYAVAKPVIIKTGSGFAMCVLTAPQHLDRRRVADLLHEKEVRLATEAELAQLFPDCELGAEPPIGTMFSMATYADEKLLDDEFLVMQAGTHRDSIRMWRGDWERVCRPVIAQIAMA
jgi:Ala-tRNA(Pro) deacylase